MNDDHTREHVDSHSEPDQNPVSLRQATTTTRKPHVRKKPTKRTNPQRTREHSRYATQTAEQNSHESPATHPLHDTSASRTPQFQPLFLDEPRHPALTRRMFLIGGVAAACGIGLAGYAGITALLPAHITVNGTAIDVGFPKTVAHAFELARPDVTPGNLVDVEGNVLKQGEGNLFSALLNSKDVDGKAGLTNGDEIVFTNGSNVEEPCERQEEEVAPEAEEIGHGPLHIIDPYGTPGTQIVKTGKLSGKTASVIEKEPIKTVYRRCYPDVGNDKVVALTFDDGPWENTTAAILDILKEYNIHATFFVVGQRISDEGVSLVEREAKEGHSIFTHTWDHATSGNGQGVNLGFMTKEEQRDEITKGYEAIEKATGTKPEHIMRAPGGNYSLEVWQNLQDIVDADIGWDIDTLDWKRPGVAHIVKQIESATPGDIILMHDGGGDRSQTVEALKTAIPYLIKEGFSFVTVDQLMKYPHKDN